MEDQKRIVEINGMKLEVDLRSAKRIDLFKVGDPVKVLQVSDQYTSQRLYAGVIVGFTEFETCPVIEVMVLMDEYNGVEFKFIQITSQVTSGEGNKPMPYEIAHFSEYESLFSKQSIVDKFNRKIEEKEIEIEEMKRKKKYFIDKFEKAFSQIIPTDD